MTFFLFKGAFPPCPAPALPVLKDVLYDKLMGYWVGQLVGNFMGLPFEFTYWDEPMPLEPQTYYDEHTANASGLNVNGPCETDLRGCIPQTLHRLQGAYTDDDTDIEFVTMHAITEHGLDLNYEQIAEYWKKYINIKVDGNDTLWFANRVARENMDKGHWLLLFSSSLLVSGLFDKFLARSNQDQKPLPTHFGTTGVC